MILDLPKVSLEEYNEAKKEFYLKPGKPDIENELEDFQRALLIGNDFTVLPEFQNRLAVYSKSILLKDLKGGADFIEPEKVEELAEISASNFIKRYFRLPNPVVGASFAGILQFKVREVLSNYFKSTTIESHVSLDTEIGDRSNNALTVEQLLAYKEYVTNEADNESKDIEDYIEVLLEKVSKELKLLQHISTEKKLDLLFLEYLIFLCNLQVARKDRKLLFISSQALRFVANSEKQLVKLTPILESALLDIAEI